MKTFEITGLITFKLEDLYVEVQDGFDIDDTEAVKGIAMQYIGAEHLNWDVNVDEDLRIEYVFDCDEML